MKDNNEILIGKIVAAQGLKGEVRVQTYTANSADLQKLKIESGNLKFKFVRDAGRDVAIMKVDGINDRNAAEDLRGTELFVNRDALPPLPAGEFYHTDLIGMDVIGFGKVIDIHNFGAGDILELENGEMISFANAVVDLENKTIKI